jgi:hypothetical protein
MLNLTDNYATRGRGRGLRVELRPRGLALAAAAPPGPPVAEAEEMRELPLGPRRLRLDARLAGAPAGAILGALADAAPALDLAALPPLVELRVTAAPLQALVSGHPLDGHLRAPAALALEEPFWRSLLAGLGVAQALLWHLHPCYDDELLLGLVGAELREELRCRLAEVEEVARRLALAPPHLLGRLAERAVTERYDALKVFKWGELHAHLEASRAAGAGLEARALAASFVAAKHVSYEGFRERFLAGLEGARRAAVLQGIEGQLAAVFAELLYPERIPVAVPLEMREAEAEALAAYEKLLRTHRLELPVALSERVGRHGARLKLLEKLAGAQALVEKGRERDARAQLAALVAREGEALAAHGLLGEVRRLRWRALCHPVQRLIDRWNMDQLW